MSRQRKIPPRLERWTAGCTENPSIEPTSDRGSPDTPRVRRRGRALCKELELSC
jgi:hypothetical protein